jgi:hypothetical protein
MPRNLSRRVETMFPVEEHALKQRVIEALELKLAENVRARELMADGTYVRVRRRRGQRRVDSQAVFQQRALAEHAPEPEQSFTTGALLHAPTPLSLASANGTQVELVTAPPPVEALLTTSDET